jgi:hypothetical protein
MMGLSSAKSEFDTIAERLAGGGVSTGRMFGADTLLHGGTLIACLKGDLLGFKLGADPAALEAALALPGASLFDPNATGSPFRGWVALPVEQSALWPDLAEQALTIKLSAR